LNGNTKKGITRKHFEKRKKQQSTETKTIVKNTIVQAR